MSGVAAAALFFAPGLVGPAGFGSIGLDGKAFAQGNRGGQGAAGGRGGQGYRGGQGTAGPGSTTHGGGHGEDEESSHGGEDSHSDGDHADESHTDEGKRGPQYMGGSAASGPDGSGGGTSGGRPAWAAEGIPEVELGRLNVSRSPSQVLERAFTEVTTNFDPAASASLYSQTAENFSNYVATHWDTVTIVDLPLQNLGLFRDLLANGQTQLPSVVPASKVDLAAIFLGTASDKTLPITRDTVVAVTRILDVPATESEITAIAAKSEIVRQGVLTGHGE